MVPSVQLAVVLLLSGLAILGVELFVPSAGMLFLMAAACVIGSVTVAFMVDVSTGMGFLLVVLLMTMTLPWIGYELWRRSPIGRRMFLAAPDGAGGSTDGEPGDRPSKTSSTALDYSTLRGRVGRTLTPLRPAGAADFDGVRVDTVAE
ncbi:MAG: hypothetical protein ACRDD1_13030, partial [Planctomycetia bacterium]